MWFPGIIRYSVPSREERASSKNDDKRFRPLVPVLQDYIQNILADIRLWVLPEQLEGISLRSFGKGEAIFALALAGLLQDQQSLRPINARNSL